MLIRILKIQLLSTLLITMSSCSNPDSTNTEQADIRESDINSSHETAKGIIQDGEHKASDIVSINTINGSIKLPKNPHPLVVYDMTLMQDLAALGIIIDGVPNKILFNNLKNTAASDAKKVGTVFEPNLEALNAMHPKAILIGNRMSKKYEELDKIAPTLDLSVSFNDLYGSSKHQLTQLGILFDKQAEAQQLQQNIGAAITATKAVTHDRGTGLVISVKGNVISTFGLNSRYGYVHKDFGIPTADPSIGNATHGYPISFEYIRKADPDWLLLLDYNAATDSEGKNAYAVLDNKLIHQTKAWKNQQIVYLSSDSYLAFGSYYHWMNDAARIQKAFQKASVFEHNKTE